MKSSAFEVRFANREVVSLQQSTGILSEYVLENQWPSNFEFYHSFFGRNCMLFLSNVFCCQPEEQECRWIDSMPFKFSFRRRMVLYWFLPIFISDKLWEGKMFFWTFEDHLCGYDNLVFSENFSFFCTQYFFAND